MPSQSSSSGVETRLREQFPSDRFPEVVSLYLFGSVAEQTTHRDSDVDVGVLVDRRAAPSRADRSELRVRLGSELIALAGRNEVDVVVLNDAPPLFARAIVTRGTRLLCQDDDTDRRFVLDTLLRAADLEPWLRRMQRVKAEVLTEVTLVERLAELKQHLKHLRGLQERVASVHDLEDDMSLHNDVLFSLLMVAQLVVDISGGLCSEAGLPFEDYTTAVRSLSKIEGFTPELVDELSRLPGFRSVLLHDYVELDYDLVLRAMTHLDPVEEFVWIVSGRVAEDDDG